MKTTLHVNFMSESDKTCHGSATLECELPFTPCPHIDFENPVWHKGRTPKSIFYDTKAGLCSVYLGIERVDTKEDVGRCAEMYKGHGWTVTVV